MLEEQWLDVITFVCDDGVVIFSSFVRGHLLHDGADSHAVSGVHPGVMTVHKTEISGLPLAPGGSSNITTF